MLAIAALLALVVPQSEKSRPVTWRSLPVGELQISFQERRLFRDHGQLARYLALAGGTRTPKVDFAKRQLLLLTTGARSSSGYEIDVLGATERGDTITVKVRERAPGLSERVDPHVTYPYRLISLPAGKSVFVDWLGR